MFGSTTLTGVVLSMIISMLCSLLGAPSALVQKKQIEMKDIENNDKDTEQKECNNKNNHVAFALTALPKKPFCQCRPSEWTVSKVKRMCIVLYLSLVFLKLKLKSIFLIFFFFLNRSPIYSFFFSLLLGCCLDCSCR